MQTVRLVRRTRPDDIGVSVSYPLPNTRFYERVRQQLGSKRNWRDSDDLSVIFKGCLHQRVLSRGVETRFTLKYTAWSQQDVRSTAE